MKKLFTVVFAIAYFTLSGQEIVKDYFINKKYLNIPIDMEQERQMVHFVMNEDTLTYSVMRIANEEPDYWVFKEVSMYTGEKLQLVFSESVKGIEKIYLSDRFAGADSLYREIWRPQFHFSSRRGWNNDPNGLVYFDGEYHLFYQHNPYEIHWQNMHWGHAVSKDLVHWKELNDALFPDPLGTMFSGSAVIDKHNTSGWGKNAMVAYYTAAGKKQTQCVAYSNDRGRTFTKYDGNPVLGGTRDPKVIWYEPNREWVMALYEHAGIRIYTSKNLKDWEKQGYTKGFYECPELFELPIDGKKEQTLWVMYGGSGSYMLGEFDGRNFNPKFGKYRNTYGSHYAAQTYNNTPDGKRIQIGWGRIESKGMPFNQLMCFPTELTLRTTNEGVRMFSEPLHAIEQLHAKTHNLSTLDAEKINASLINIKHDLLQVKAKLESLDGRRISLDYQGNRILDMDGDEINRIQTPLSNPGSLVFDIEILIDKTSIESFVQKGKIVFVHPLKNPKKRTGLEIIGDPNAIKVHHFEVNELKSIWSHD